MLLKEKQVQSSHATKQSVSLANLFQENDSLLDSECFSVEVYSVHVVYLPRPSAVIYGVAKR